MAWFSDDAPEVGARSPRFAVSNQHGQHVSTDDLAGEPALLFFYPFAFTSVCSSEIQGLVERHPRFQAVGCRVLAISTDTMFALRAFAEAQSVAFELLSDHWPHGAVAREFGVFDEQYGCARRASFLLDASGTVVWRTSGELPQSRDLDAHLDAAEALRSTGPR